MEQIINGRKYFYDNVSLNSFRFPQDPKKLLVKLSLAARLQAFLPYFSVCASQKGSWSQVSLAFSILDSVFFFLLGLMILLKMSPRTHHNYL